MRQKCSSEVEQVKRQVLEWICILLCLCVWVLSLSVWVCVHIRQWFVVGKVNTHTWLVILFSYTNTTHTLLLSVRENILVCWKYSLTYFFNHIYYDRVKLIWVWSNYINFILYLMKFICNGSRIYTNSKRK